MTDTENSSQAGQPLEGYNFAYLDEGTKRMIRRALLKAVAIPGYQVPFASREMPMPFGWGTGGIQITASIIGRDDVLKVIDQGSDDTTNAVSIRDFFRKTTGVATTTHTDEATIIQTRHRIPEQPLTESQIIEYQVPLPEPPLTVTLKVSALWPPPATATRFPVAGRRRNAGVSAAKSAAARSRARLFTQAS